MGRPVPLLVLVVLSVIQPVHVTKPQAPNSCPDRFLEHQNQYVNHRNVYPTRNSQGCADACLQSSRRCYGYSIFAEVWCSLVLYDYGESDVISNTRSTWYQRIFTCQPSVVTSSCESVPTISNGSPTTQSTQTGTTVSYRCNSGYTLSHSTPLTCQVTLGRHFWSGAIPACNRIVLCESVPTIPNGSPNTQSRDVGTTVSYRCNSGYTLSHSNPLTCQAYRGRAYWTSARPNCIRPATNCESVPTIANGSPTTESTQVGTTVSYSCNTWFALSHSNPLTCQAYFGHAYWAGARPTCNRVALCDSVPTIPNGSPNTQSRDVGTTVSYRCNPGYTLSHSNPLTCRLYRRRAFWTGARPTCNRG